MSTLFLRLYPGGMTNSCAFCRKVLRSGYFLACLRVGDDEYMIGPNPPLSCCGGEKMTLELFETEDEGNAFLRKALPSFSGPDWSESFSLFDERTMSLN